MSLYSKLKAISVVNPSFMCDDDVEECVTLLKDDSRCEQLMTEHNCDAFLLLIPGYGTTGRIFFDKNKRFCDGCVVQTSSVQSVSVADKDFTIFQTRNTRYLCLG